jgi:aspartate aminotransferase
VEPSKRTARLQPSPTMAIDARAKALKASGVDVVNFGAGEPDFDTPAHIRDAAIAALERGETRYTAAAGTEALRRAAAAYASAATGVSYAASQVVISVGAKHSIFNALMALVNPGDGVLLPAPYWVSYPEQIRLAEGIPVPVPLSPANGFRLTRGDLEAAWRPGVTGLILNAPSNPTGAVIPPDELARIAAFVEERDLWVISDEIYDQLVYGDVPHRSLAGLPGMADRTVYVNGVSKTYAMTGWRIGFAAAPPPVAAAMERLQSQCTSNPTTFAQAGALAALTGPQEPVREMLTAFRERRELAYRLVSQIPGLIPLKPDGAFYLWVEMEDLIGCEIAGQRVENGDHLAAVLLEAARVAVVPGSGFGRPQGFRLSFATSRDRIEEGIRRIAALLDV